MLMNADEPAGPSKRDLRGSIPYRVRRRLQRAVGIYFGCSFVIIGSYMLIDSGGAQSRLRTLTLDLALAAGMTLISAIGVWVFVKGEILYRRAKRQDFADCIWCGHSLVGLGAQGICPECGREYTLADNQRVWRQARSGDVVPIPLP